MSANVASIADAAARAVFAMFIVLGVGATFAFAGKIDKKGLQSLGVSINYLFVPAIMFYSFGAELSVDALKSAWVVTLVGLLTTPISAIISYPMMLLSKPPDWFRVWFMFGATFQNTVAIPLVLMQSVCGQLRVPDRDDFDQIVTDGNGTILYMDEVQCNRRGNLFIFLFIFIQSIVFWIVAFEVMPVKTIQIAPSTTPNASSSVEGNNTSTQAADNLSEDSDSEERGITQGATAILPNSPTRLKETKIDNSMFISGSFSGGIPEYANRKPSWAPVFDPIDESEIDANNEQVIKSQKMRIVISSKINIFCSRLIGIILRPPIIAQLLGSFVGLIAPLQAVLFTTNSVLRPLTLSIKIFADASTAITNLSMASGLGLKLMELKSKSHLFGGEEGGLSRRATLLFVLTKMVIVPGCLTTTIYLLQISKILPQDRLLLISLYIQCMTPSANTVVVIPQITGNLEASGALSLLILSQYIVALPTMIFWLTLAFYLTRDVM